MMVKKKFKKKFACDGVRVTKRDDFFRVIFDHFEASSIL